MVEGGEDEVTFPGGDASRLGLFRPLGRDRNGSVPFLSSPSPGEEVDTICVSEEDPAAAAAMVCFLRTCLCLGLPSFGLDTPFARRAIFSLARLVLAASRCCFL